MTPLRLPGHKFDHITLHYQLLTTTLSLLDTAFLEDPPKAFDEDHLSNLQDIQLVTDAAPSAGFGGL